MSFKRISVVAVSGLLALAACAQQEEPTVVAPEPVYDKYGNAVAECRPPDRPVSATYSARLPICEPSCPPGQQSAVGAAPNVCVPIPQRDGGGDGQTGRGQQGPVGRP